MAEINNEKTPAGKFVAERQSSVGSFWQHMNAYKSPEIIFTGPDDAHLLKQYVGNVDGSTVIPDAILASKSWRDASVNGVVDVDPRVVLVTEKTEYSEGYQFETGVIGDLESSDWMKPVKGIIEGVNAGINSLESIMTGTDTPSVPEDSFISKYTGMRYLKNIKANGINEMTYTFRMGSSGIFDAYKEVVEPIVALVCCFAPTRNPDNPAFLKGPAPTKSYVVSEVVKTLYQDIRSDSNFRKSADEYSPYYNNSKREDEKSESDIQKEEKALFNKYWKNKTTPNISAYGPVTDANGNQYVRQDAKDEEQFKRVVAAVRAGTKSNNSNLSDSERATLKEQERVASEKAKGLSGLVNAAEKKLMDALNNASEALLSSGKLTTCSFKIGHMLFGPYFAGNINWAFDYTQVDENGWPFAGYVQISDLQPMLLMERFDIAARLVDTEIAYTDGNGQLSPPLNLAGYHTSSPYGKRWVPKAGLDENKWYKGKAEFEAMYNAGMLTIKSHSGIDLSHGSCKGDAVHPIYDGKIIYAANSNDFGNCIIIKHSAPFNNLMSLYAHLRDLNTANGLKAYNGGVVTKSTVIGQVDGTNSYSPHLHFGMMKCSPNDNSAYPGDNHTTVDPASYFRELTEIVINSEKAGYFWRKDGATG